MGADMKISISNNIKRIQVNDAGEFIELNMDDQTLIPRLYAMMQDFEKIADTHRMKAAGFEEMPEETDKQKTEKIIAYANVQLDVCRELKSKVDAAFQDDVCRKVFGDIVPSVAAFAEFFAQLNVLLLQFKREQSENKISKYTQKYHAGK